MNCKANSILCTFKWADPFIKCFLIKSYCLSLYGSVLWSLSSPAVKMIEVSLNKLLRKIWNLHYNSHTGILHCVAHVSTISNIIIAERLSVRQIILHRISSRVCIYVCMYVCIYVSRLGMRALRVNVSITCVGVTHRNVACWIIDATSLRVHIACSATRMQLTERRGDNYDRRPLYSSAQH